MRVLTVSAHYPPNFVSGGTLQPQRVSQSLRDRGHEVSVFAGWIGERPELQEWDDVDETGMPVHWIVSAPWIGWADERNWLNPEVTDRFRAHLEAVQPDVVHFHALQSLGAGLLPAAKAAGAVVAVTMHDFWWLCTRQFLVDRDYRPCALVTEAGGCPCEVDEATREHRDRSLRVLLESADLVLAPSAAAAAVLEANGIGGHRLVVDENGMPADVLERLASSGAGGRHTRPADDAVRFLYAGGPNEMKGVATLLEAFREIGSLPGWTLTAHGIAEYLERSSVDLTDLPIEAAPPYDPDALAATLGAHDVLVLPSIMRETYSLLTREALTAGLPVICTDTLGPEEVVRHGWNGLVVPAADATSLAHAVRSLVEDRSLLESLRRQTTEPVEVRSLAHQAGELEARFDEQMAGPTRRAASDRGPKSVLFVCGIDGAPLRYRVHLPAEALALRGVRSEVLHYRSPELLAASRRAEVVVVYRSPATVQLRDQIEAIRSGGTPVLFDVDDLVFDPEIAEEIPALRLLPEREADLWMEGVRRYRTTLEMADGYIGSTAMLVQHAAGLVDLPCSRFDNGVGMVLGRLSDQALRRPRSAGPVRLGYFSGTTTHDEDWFFVEPAVAACMDAHPDVELWLGGHLPSTPELARFGDRVHRIPFVPWTELPSILRQLDVNLAPLAPGSRFNEAKSAIKWLEAALCSTPTVASPTGPFREAIEPTGAGLMAEDLGAWTAAIEALVVDEAERRRLGERARRRALLEWSPWRQGERYSDILHDATERGPLVGRATSWTPTLLDEPSMVVDLEGYPPPARPAPVEPEPAAARSGGVPSRIGSLLRREGVAGVVRRTLEEGRDRAGSARDAWVAADRG